MPSGYKYAENLNDYRAGPIYEKDCKYICTADGNDITPQLLKTISEQKLYIFAL